MQSMHNNIIITHQNNNHTKNITTTAANNNNSNNNKNISRGPTTQPRSSHGPTTAAQACAACKHRRSKCASDCILAPYFPHDRHAQFLNAHRLFGVSNIIKIVRHLDPPEKDHAMRTIIFQSDARAADPVGGCCRIIRDLEHRISLARAELDIVLHHLALFRAAAHQQQQVAAPPEEEGVAMDDVGSWGCMMDGNVVHALAESTSSSFPHRHRHNPDHDHQHARKLSMEECSDDMIRPILDHLDVREEEFKFDSHGNIIPSNNGILTEEKDTFKEDDECFSYVQDHHDLKAAATFFSLTNCDI